MVRLMLFTTLILVSCWSSAQNDRSRYRSQSFDRRSSLDSMYDKALWQSSGWAASPTFGFERSGYDSNVLGEVEQDRVADYSLSPYVGVLTLWRPTSRFAWETEVRTAYTWYHELEELNGLDLIARTRLHGMFKRSYLGLEYQHRKSLERPNLEIEDRADHNSSRVTAEAIFQVTPRGFMGLTYTANTLSFETSGSSLTNYSHDANRFQGNYTWQRTRTFWPFLELSYEVRDFSDRADPYEFTASSAAVGFRNEVGERTHFDMRFGPMEFDYKYDLTPALDDEQTLVFVQGFGDFKITRRLSIDLSLRQTPIASIFPGFNHYISSHTAMGIAYKLTKKVSMGPSIQIGRNDYRHPLNDFTDKRRDDITLAAITTRINIKGPYELSFSLGWQERDSTLISESDEGFTAFFDFSYDR